METKTITYNGQGCTIKAIVGEASSLRGMKRTVLINQAVAGIRAEQGLGDDTELPDDVEVIARSFLRRYTYPNCLACLLEAEGFAVDLRFEEFAELPDVFVGQWERAAIELNPHWQLRTAEEEKAEEKKKSPPRTRKPRALVMDPPRGWANRG